MQINFSDTAFMLLATALVFIMTPGLAFFYGGLVGRRNVSAIMMQSFVSLGVTTMLWVTVGYSFCFGSDIGGIIGNPSDFFLLSGIAAGDIYPDLGIPVYLFVAYQLMFAIITPALITGAFANRMTFKAYLTFLVSWQLLVYYPFVHMVWGGGWMAEYGVLDFAGGIVVHTIAGMAALATVFFLGKRRVSEPEPHNIPFVALGTALLWFGWFGFNAGSALAVNEITTLAFINTQIGGAFAGVTWMILEWQLKKKPTLVGFCVGVVAGLATITPAAGFVTPQSAMLIGILAGSIPYAAVAFRQKRNWDDALDVWGVHGIGGTVGILALGLLATKGMNPDGADGLFYGNSSFFVKELVGVLVGIVWAFTVTSGLLWAINKVTPVRVSDADEQAGLDNALHGETAYVGAD
ncbi:MAG: ammonium transporter [Gemmatimonadetes bacterium]|nr:ammonium transporter [Gemmatimonadota bacterium]